MKPIERNSVQAILNSFVGRETYLHLETTNGAYAVHHQEGNMVVGAYIRNAQITYSRGVIAGDGPFRVGLKLDIGWVYAEGLTDFETDGDMLLLLAGHDQDGRLAVSLELSTKPFEM